MKNTDKIIKRYVILSVLILICVLFRFNVNVLADTAVSAQIPINQICKTNDSCSYFLNAEESSAPMPKSSRMTLKGNENGTFTVLCMETGVWHYILQSENPNSSPTKYLITIQAIENNGRLATVTECYDDNGYKTTPVFKLKKNAAVTTTSSGSSIVRPSKGTRPSAKARNHSTSTILKANPKTGDTVAAYGYFALFLVSGIVIIMTVIKKKRKN